MFLKILSHSKKCMFFFLLYSLFSSKISSQPGHTMDLDQMYWDARFHDVVNIFQIRKYQDLALSERLLYIECLARIGKGSDAIKKIVEIPFESPLKNKIYACAGWVYLSLGNLDRSGECFDIALGMDGDCHVSNLGRVMLFLFLKHYSEAERLFDNFLERKQGLKQTFQVFLVGIEVYNANRNFKKLFHIYSHRANWIKKKDKNTSINLRATAQLYKKMKNGNLFEVDADVEMISIPFVESGQNRFMVINYPLANNKKFRILLDTGNATGWMIHDRELYKSLNLIKGGKSTVKIGTEAEALDGYRIFNERLDFGFFKMLHLSGYYIPKPRSDFFDANLNPTFIRNRVVSLDGQNRKLILRTEKAFHEYLKGMVGKRLTKLPWYGYEHAFVPVVVNEDHGGLALIETGAEDIAIQLDFAQIIQLPLRPKIKYLSNGQVFHFFETKATVTLGGFPFKRESLEVWSFDKFARHLFGLKPDVILGPQIFREASAISFNPFSNEIFVESDSL